MTNYRRARAAGGTFFFTLALAQRAGALLVDHHDLLRESMRQVLKVHSCQVDAIVVLPDHLHAIWTLPRGDSDFSTRWALIKARFSRGLPPGERRSASRESKRERGIWQRRFWEHQIRGDEDLARHVDYIHYNPVKHGLVERVIEWPWSSFHRYVARGDLAPDWAAEPVLGGPVGERDQPTRRVG
jgi:putative transposase